MPPVRPRTVAASDGQGGSKIPEKSTEEKLNADEVSPKSQDFHVIQDLEDATGSDGPSGDSKRQKITHPGSVASERHSVGQAPLALSEEMSDADEVSSSDEVVIMSDAPIQTVSELYLRLFKWIKRVGDRQSKSSDATTKRNSYPIAPLMFTHTAPPHLASRYLDRLSNPLAQGKDFSSVKKFDYSRTGDNSQTALFKHHKKKLYLFTEKALENYYKWGRRKDDEARAKELKNLEASAFLRNENASVLPCQLTRHVRPVGSFLGADANSYVKLAVFSESKIVKSKVSKDRVSKCYISESENAKPYVLAKLNEIVPVSFLESHSQVILKNCRDIVEQLESLDRDQYWTVSMGKCSGQDGSNFLDYPSVIVELKKPNDLQAFMEKIQSHFNKANDVKLFCRQSFGFVMPSISLLDKSIRIWPGHMDPGWFVPALTDALAAASITMFPIDAAANSSAASSSSPSMTTAPKYSHLALVNTLNRALAFVRSVYIRLPDDNGPQSEQVCWLHNRVIANVIKAMLLKRTANGQGMAIQGESGQLQTTVDTMPKTDILQKQPQQFTLEVNQVIENLNEYGFQLMEGVDHSNANTEFEDAVKAGFPKQIGEFAYQSARLCHSGMQAGNLALGESGNMENVSHVDAAVYFEFTKTGPFHLDPSYNLTHRDALELPANAFKLLKGHKVVVLDMTNVAAEDFERVFESFKNGVTTRAILYSSLSKHFQLGRDAFTLGLILDYRRPAFSPDANTPKQVVPYMPNALMTYYAMMQRAQAAGASNWSAAVAPRGAPSISMVPAAEAAAAASSSTAPTIAPSL